MGEETKEKGRKDGRHREGPAPPEPGRTPGQAEGTNGDVTGGGHPVLRDPGRTPGQAEGTVGDVTGNGHPDPQADEPGRGRKNGGDEGRGGSKGSP